MKVGSNGHLTFGTANNNFNAECIPQQANTTFAIMPYRTDKWTGPCFGNVGTNLGIFTSISGSSPNRIFNIEYRTAYYDTGQTTNIPLNYEVRLYEGLNEFDLIYGTVSTIALNDSVLTVGVTRNGVQATEIGCDLSGGNAPPVSAGNLPFYPRARLPES